MARREAAGGVKGGSVLGSYIKVCDWKDGAGRMGTLRRWCLGSKFEVSMTNFTGLGLYFAV